MNHPPKFKYAGLTIVLSQGSRFDEKQLLSGTAGWWFENVCLQPTVNRWQCHILTLDDFKKVDLMPETKAILVLGEAASQYLAQNQLSIHAQRGSPFSYHNVPCIASYLPQDAFDPIKDYEEKYNAAFQDSEDEGSESKDKETKEKDRSRTKRTSWRFWIEQDVKKCLKIVRGQVPVRSPTPAVRLYPPLAQVCDVLRSAKEGVIFLDIETDYHMQMYCVGFSIDDGDVYVVPVMLFNYTPAYEQLHYFFKALACAFKRNRVVIHNSSFDLTVLALRYGVPFSHRIYDTMLAHHRCYPEVEKSLGHCISLYTWEPFHKDEHVMIPKSTQQEEQLWRYNAKDVNTMRQIYYAIEAKAKSDPGLRASIDQVNASVYTYLVVSLMGMRFNDEKRQHMIQENDRYMMQILRWTKILVGHDMLPSSSKQCVQYFHEELGYDVVMRSKKTGAPSIDAGAIEKLKLKHPDNPVLQICMAYRELKKETGSLGFKPWSLTNEIPNWKKGTVPVEGLT